MKTLSILRTIAVALVLFVSMPHASGTPTDAPKAPDFAYPKTVAANAEKNLKEALAANDDGKILRSLIDLTIAKGMISVDNMPDILNRTAEISAKLQGTAAGALVDLLRAEIYADIYIEDVWTYDERPTVAGPLPKDYKLWSGEQFRARFAELCDSVLLNSALLKSTPITAYPDVIETSAEQKIYFPTLYDFAIYHIIDIYSYYDVENLEAAKITRLYEELITANADKDAPRLLAAAKLFNALMGDEENDIDKERILLELMNLYNANSQSQYSGQLLSALYRWWDRDEDRTSIVSKTDMANLLRAFIQRHPSYHGLQCIKSNLFSILHPYAKATAPGAVIPGKPFRISITNSNNSQVSICIYKIPSKNLKLHNGSYLSSTSGKELIKTINIDFAQPLPFSVDTIVECTLPDFGVYAIELAAPVSEGYTYSTPQPSIIRATNLSMGSITFRDCEAYVVDATTGAPISGASINYFNTTQRTVTIQNLGSTDKEGFFTIPASLDRNWIYAAPQLGNDRYAPPFIICTPSGPWNPKDVLRGTLYTDLPLYHQGDTVRWSAVAYIAAKSGMKPAANLPVRVVMCNANNQPIDTIQITTDRWGRASGEFPIPSGQLTGTYDIELKPIFNKGVSAPSVESISTTFSVSDYKLPTFNVEVTSVARNTPTKGAFTISGVVRSYSGVGLANTSVAAEIKASRNYYGSQTAVYSDSVTTDPEGRFTIVLPDSVTESLIKVRYYTALLTATSISGETQSCIKTFYPGTTYSLSGNIPADINAEKPEKLRITVFNPEGEQVIKDVRVTLKSGDVEKFSGVYPSDEVAVPWARIPSGTYSVTITGIDIDADTISLKEFAVYRTTDKKSPVAKRLWMPQSNVESQPNDRHFTLHYAAETDDTYVLYALSVNDSLIERRWIKAHAGMNALKVSVPEGSDKAEVDLITVSDFKTYMVSARLEVTHPESDFTLVAESFRDKLVPGETEIWTFRTRKGANPCESAIMLSMYNDALNSLAEPSSLNFRTRPLYYSSGSHFGRQYAGSAWTQIQGYTGRIGNCSISQPEFNTYGYALFGFGRIMGGEVVTAHGIMYGAAAPQAVMRKSANGAVAEMAMEVADEAMDEGAEETTEDERADIVRRENTMSYVQITRPDSQNEQPFQYRDALVPLAFFRPMLQTDANGELSFTFRVPNANARWYFQAMAFDSELSTAYQMKQIVANKPLMVQPNLPRFLRHGDRAKVETLVINNSEDNARITVTTELFDPTTGAVVSASDTIIYAEANTQAKVATTLAAPLNASLLGFRVKATDGRFTDGEQSYLPILASVTPVIDTYPFYIPTDSAHFEMQLPELPDSSRVTLQFCDNPIWYVVTALPGLSEANYNSAPAAAAALFSASAASGLLKKYPQIGEGLRQWVAGDGSDSTLVSMLERNADLKTLLLEATPWIQDANSDTERMQRLALLLDRKQIEAAQRQAIDMLSRLHVSGEGWRWIGRYELSSMWATSSTLTILGRLRALGFLPDDKALATMINQSLRWYEKQTEKEYRKYPKGSYWQYVELCALWPAFKQSQTGKSLTAKYVQRTVSSWKKMPLAEKPHAAMLLKQYGYPRVAKQIMESVMEFSESSPTKGMYWPSVNERFGDTMVQLMMASSAMSALSTILGESARPSVDAIAQWLLLQKETRNWGTSAIATEVITRIIQATSDWLTNAKVPVVALGGEVIAAKPAESKLGYFRCDISDMAPAGKVLSIDSCGIHPSWGAIFVQSVQPMLEIKAAGCEELTIEKNIYVRRGNELIQPDTIRVGDRLTIQLTLRATRDMEYVAIVDDRSAAMEPVDQLPGTVLSEGLCFYRESLDSSTRLFIDRLPQGTYLLRYDVWANNAGLFTTGIASAQSQYAPSMSAHSGGSIIEVTR